MGEECVYCGGTAFGCLDLGNAYIPFPRCDALQCVLTEGETVEAFAAWTAGMRDRAGDGRAYGYDWFCAVWDLSRGGL